MADKTPEYKWRLSESYTRKRHFLSTSKYGGDVWVKERANGAANGTVRKTNGLNYKCGNASSLEAAKAEAEDALLALRLEERAELDAEIAAIRDIIATRATTTAERTNP
jgi:hypothetical protein